MQTMRKENKPEQNRDVLRVSKNEMPEVRQDVFSEGYVSGAVLGLQRGEAESDSQERRIVDDLVVKAVFYKLRTNVRQFLKQNKISTRVFAKELGVSQATVQTFLSGRSSPSFYLLVKVLYRTGYRMTGVMK